MVKCRRTIAIPVELIDRGYNISERVIRRPFREPRREVKVEVLTLLEARPREIIDLDPLDRLGGASLATRFILYDLSCPPTTTTWSQDPQPDCTILSVDNSRCYAGSGECSPVLLVLNQALSGSPGSARDNVSAYAVPAHVASLSPCNQSMTYSGGGAIPKIPSGLLLKGTDCDDTGNKARFNSYSARDDSSASYSIASLALARMASAVSSFTLFSYFNLPSVLTKSATDIFLYIYRFGLYYA
jgi:hypothetical protein